MIFNRNVLRFGMHHRILADTDGAGVIAKDGNRLINLDLKILQSLLHQRTCVQQVVVMVYFVSAMDNEIEDCFLLKHETRQPPR